MLPLRNRPSGDGTDDRVLDAARASILAVGFRRTTLTEVARRAGLSRMTIYRRWPDTRTLLADLLTREWARLSDATDLPQGAATPAGIAAGVVGAVKALRGNALFE